MVIVGGWFEVQPDERDAFIASRLDGMRTSRAEHGCLEYTLAADPIEPDRVVLFEHWESREALDAHLAAPRQSPSDGPAPAAASVVIYDVTGVQTLI